MSIIDLKLEYCYDVGNRLLDDEHRTFFQLIKNVADAHKNHASKEKTIRLLNEVKLYASYHFCREDNLMLDSNFQGYSAHHKEHKKILAEMNDQIRHFRADDIEPGKVVSSILFWFKKHTTIKDKVLADYLRIRTNIKRTNSQQFETTKRENLEAYTL